MNQIANKVALVTGGGRGIGAAVAVRLAEAGADVVLTYAANEERAAETVRLVEKTGRRGLAVRADAADSDAVRDSVAQAVTAFGRLDFLIGNAAVFPMGPLDEVTDEQIDRALAVNVRAQFVAAQAASEVLPDGGRIVLVGSNITERLPFAGMTLYAMTKTAMTGLAKGLARDLGPRRITANVVHPGATDTDMNPADGPLSATIAGLTALGRYAAPSEIAETVLHLCGPGGDYITGASIRVDGGFTV